ncbi:MFS transporter [Herbaspirillum autotrophicum]|uniref:MFS transporter n=1 Tax=Herbaspirillum autotrophicum TaxID=180195 RepID=UPI0009FADA4C|nr:MFS transporter [Herbaspirillum autotrophicum]
MNALTTKSIARQRWLIILPVTFIMYTISFFDRANMGMALPHITRELALTPVQAGLLGAAFAWGYAITQIGGGIIALLVNPRRLIAISLMLFGGAALATGLARTLDELIICRILLGLAEGPLYATVALFLAQWFMKSERGRAFGIWNLAIPAGGFLAGPISGAILAHYDWRIMMIVEGLPAWIFCVIWLIAIPKNLESARWLSQQDRVTIRKNLAEEQATHQKTEKDPWWSVLTEPTVWLLTAGFALNGILMYGMTLWLPTIMHTYGKLSEVSIGFFSGLPFIASMLGIFYITRRSDKHGQERRLHAAIPTALTGVMMIAAALIPIQLYYLQIILFVAVGFTLKMINPLIFAWITEILPTRKAIPAVAIVSGVGNLIGQSAGPLLVGYVKSHSSDYVSSLLVLAVCAILGGVAIACAGGKERRQSRADATALPAGNAAHGGLRR